MHVAGHAGRHHPASDRARIEKRAIDSRARRFDVLADTGHVHAQALTRSPTAGIDLELVSHPAVPDFLSAGSRVPSTTCRQQNCEIATTSVLGGPDAAFRSASFGHGGSVAPLR